MSSSQQLAEEPYIDPNVSSPQSHAVFRRTHWSTTLPHTPRSDNRCPAFGMSRTKFCMNLSHLSSMCSQSPVLNHPNYIWWRLKIMNLPTTQYFPASCYNVRTSSLRNISQLPVTIYEPPHYAVLPSLLLQCMNLLTTQYFLASCYNVRTSPLRSTSQSPITMY